MCTYTNADRTVHLSEQAVEPPGQARSDFAMFCDYAHRLDLRDKEGAPLVKWTTPEEAFEAFGRMTAGRMCDQSGLTYDKLRGGSGIPWPCTQDASHGTERLYTDGHFATEAHFCESYGHDLETGAINEPDEYRAHDPQGRAFLKAAHFKPVHEPIDNDYPLQLSTGRVVYHWHTRTKTGRAPQLNESAPQVWVELCRVDAEAMGIAEGEQVRVQSRRGTVQGPARLTGHRPGVVFVPLHYGYWDAPEGAPPTAANEVTRTEWDPVSKQPIYKVTAVRVRRVADLQEQT